ncbi:MAG: hypothetical protein JSW39_17360 [Desulfobacterales bacterium]|nr:MAG: hypothetical protein JSW39_17360 [Desulfobacterales bacterium]
MKAAVFCLGWIVAILWLGFPAVAADKENCLMCHKYPFVGRIDENGKRHNYQVDEASYNHSVHRSVACRDCHTYITKIPHDPVTEEVNCANVCHTKPPFAQEKFSHQKIIDIYNDSAHGIKPDDSPEAKKAKPYCKFCHLNPLYTRVSEKVIAFDETLRRCLNCHQAKGVTQAYIHMTHRLRKKTTRSPQEVVQLCAKCHQDVELMQKLKVSEEGLTAVATYNHTLHGKSVALGSQETADCISCHASFAIHDIYRKDNPKATVYKDNLMQTCLQCHTETNSWFVQIAVHPRTKREENPLIYMAGIGLRFALYGSVCSLVGLMLLETYGRRKDGIKFLLRRGTSWRGKSKRPPRK